VELNPTHSRIFKWIRKFFSLLLAQQRVSY
jgi:hypothetical protein